MPIDYKKTVAMFEGHCEIEEAESLLGWLLDNPKGKVNLKQIQHLHTAVLQVLIALSPSITAWPIDESVSAWLTPKLKERHES
ncbi:MAG: hypothetical protein DRP47_11585 [Candidatus Zixiibacteriota bacterium]|nr:MAG: hypothetical protein DRP47_11585 [candidate division Zixibacteria bacterium]